MAYNGFPQYLHHRASYPHAQPVFQTRHPPAVSRLPQQYVSAMAGTPQPLPNFFADEMYHHQQDHGYEEALNQPQQFQGAMEPSSQSFAFRPLLPITSSGRITSPALTPHARSASTSMLPHLINNIPVPGILNHHIDETKYEPVHPLELECAALDYDSASSPDSVETVSPLTPASDNISSMTDHFFTVGRRYSQDPTIAEEFVQPHTYKPVQQAMYPGAAPTVAHQYTHAIPAHYGLTNTPNYSFGNDGAGLGIQFPQYHHTHSMPRYLPPAAMHNNTSMCSFEANSAVGDEAVSKADTEINASPDDEGRLSAESEDGSMDVNFGMSEDAKFLIDKRREGMSYKDIKRIGNFKEAESTLRGRYRMLTKPHTARVRKPKWTEKDKKLLRKGVAKFTKKMKTSRSKIPWKKICEWMVEQGASYSFAPATCAKVWQEKI
ncbi:hypothetical protein Tdes44962_MAKER08206 [Teratosphaeria destructans]|uniref:Myb-like domain-containing protein n=1 Tax=Teratosphaeria destructans TaxID=418781 RepID=A0A9W7SX63_9PEZI|nr:hypothetical protein Tdes44962_MAKER08206 [Teratosphaeria destructans]